MELFPSVEIVFVLCKLTMYRGASQLGVFPYKLPVLVAPYSVEVRDSTTGRREEVSKAEVSTVP
jgi:hypothetical protein